MEISTLADFLSSKQSYRTDEVPDFRPIVDVPDCIAPKDNIVDLHGLCHLWLLYLSRLFLNDENFDDKAPLVFSHVSTLLHPLPWSSLIRLTKGLLVAHAFHLSAFIAPLGLGIDPVIVPRVCSSASPFYIPRPPTLQAPHGVPYMLQCGNLREMPANKVSTVSRSDSLE